MKDLKIDYDNENGECVTKEYDTITDFIDEMESDSSDMPMMDYSNVNAKFFLKVHYRLIILQLLSVCIIIAKKS